MHIVENLKVGDFCPITNLKIVGIEERVPRAISHYVSFCGPNFLIQSSASYVEFLNQNPQVKEVVIGCLFNYPINRRIWLTQRETPGMINWKDWIAGLEYPKTDLEKVDFSLGKIQQLIGRMGKSIKFERNDPWFKLFFCHDNDEFHFILKTLKNQGYIELWDKPIGPDGQPIKTGQPFPLNVSLTYDGISFLNKKQKEIQKDLCFVAMSFGENEKLIFTEAIEPAVKACGYQARKVDDAEHHIDKEQTINDSILALAKKAHFVVCDYTGNKRGVYFEHGYAWGMGKKVIMTIKESEMADLHFDVSHYPFIVWKDFEDLRTRLQVKIESWIGKFEA